ncbi:hypothetical protein SODALDRAFT_378548 [Sodiomyces alkalinus F11]|uniref:LysM domain-containing protein n=1 Tax=Sodiomyces alkalinus (strain CBS 110278 / VKM F-3762 / F11) TaxID=1314773 RepID=A0A3N2PYD9_SODAK|nr:hypothetical protein SODALDRAFT_378548 [Sodiomyces alkalinus F11]ROT39458.1 hypothetical protein SODALDRAFT_378548 [Sodiomyces alkalinus F11]
MNPHYYLKHLAAVEFLRSFFEKPVLLVPATELAGHRLLSPPPPPPQRLLTVFIHPSSIPMNVATRFMPTTRIGSSALASRHDTASNAVRPRARHAISADNKDDARPIARSSSSLSPPLSAAPSRTPSPIAAARRPAGAGESRSVSNPHFDRDSGSRENNTLGLIENSLVHGWSSLQGLASSLLSHDSSTAHVNGHGAKPRPRGDDSSSSFRDQIGSWASRSTVNMQLDIGGFFAKNAAERNALPTADTTASVLEYRKGVDDGLDIRHNYKRRKSDDLSNNAVAQESPEDKLVYIHHVKATDTYAGIILKYRCREDAFRMLNGLWSRDIQIRTWLALPVDACDIRGRPSPPPNQANKAVEPSTRTEPDLRDQQPNKSAQSSKSTDWYGLPHETQSEDSARLDELDERPWTHVRWVTLDSHSEPVEIARIAKKTIACPPPRRKKSLHTTSTVSTPRQSLDAPGAADALGGSPGRDSTLSGRRQRKPDPHRQSPSGSSRSRVSSTGADGRPLWMRRPGGVGSMGRNVRSPGPESDPLNAWAKRHLPAIAISESLPSISVMGSETANFGFGKPDERDNSATIVESPFDEGHDLDSTSRQGSGLDRAAAQVETWLRSAFAKRQGASSTQSNWNSRSTSQVEGADLIELADTLSDDGRPTGSAVGPGLVHSERPPFPSGGPTAGQNLLSKGRHNGDAYGYKEHKGKPEFFLPGVGVGVGVVVVGQLYHLGGRLFWG